ncbi:MAG: sensor histidine kinase [Terriglobia bacterium]
MNQQRTLALAAAAHELKSPLAIMAGYLELLLHQKAGPLSDRQRTILQEMQASRTRLQNFIEDFLSYSTLETGRLQMRFERGNVNSCLRESAGVWLPQFQKKGVALYVADQPELEPFPLDCAKVQRLISILLDNALKFTPAGGTVSTTVVPHFWERRARQEEAVSPDRRQQHLQQPNAVCVSVADTGPGIAPESHWEIFDDFVALSHGEGQTNGFGLGLGIARRLAEAHGGKIWVESDGERGSKFSFLLPLKPLPEEAQAPGRGFEGE